MTQSILVVGASRGIGAEIARHFVNLAHQVIGVSRTPAVVCEWIDADVATPEGIRHVASKLGESPIDTLIFAAGVWEEHGFTRDFDFRKTRDGETRHIMSVNLIAPIELTKVLAKNLSQSPNPRAIYLGALSGLEHLASCQVAYAASKAGLRGAVQGLRVALESAGIGFTVINPGNVATEEVMDDIHAGRLKDQDPIPLSDILSAIEWIMSLSPHVETGDISLMSKSRAIGS